MFCKLGLTIFNTSLIDYQAWSISPLLFCVAFDMNHGSHSCVPFFAFEFDDLARDYIRTGNLFEVCEMSCSE